MKYTPFVFISLLYLLTTCTDETKPMSTPTPGTIASSDFQIYVDRFVSEAAKRSIKIDISRLNVVYSDTLKFYCGYGVSSTQTVQISNRPGCWSEQTDFNKEILLFHEMGHAILLRNHNNTKLPNGDFKTMMFGGNQFSLYSEDTPERRKYYLDELFNSSTPAPNWSSPKVIPTIISSDSINFSSTTWRYVQTNGSNQTGKINSLFFTSPGSSLEISSSAPSNFSYWRFELSPNGIKQSTRLTIEVNVKVNAISNDGVYVAIRGDSDTKNIFFTTTQGTTKISGTSNFVKYSVEVPYYVDTVKKIYVFLILADNATGSVYFDDIKITNYQ